MGRSEELLIDRLLDSNAKLHPFDYKFLVTGQALNRHISRLPCVSLSISKIYSDRTKINRDIYNVPCNRLSI